MEPSVGRHSGGWGLGAGNEDNSKLDEEDEPSDWEQTHVGPSSFKFEIVSNSHFWWQVAHSAEQRSR